MVYCLWTCELSFALCLKCDIRLSCQWPGFLIFVDFTHTLWAWIWWNQRDQEVGSGLNCIKFSKKNPKVILQISTTCFWRPPKIAVLMIFAILAYPIHVFVNFTNTLRAWIWWNQRAQEVWSGLNCIKFSKKKHKSFYG